MITKSYILLCCLNFTLCKNIKCEKNFEDFEYSREIKWRTQDGKPTQLSGHRGEKVLMPEHTIGSYKFAAILGADFIEPDLVLTSDGILVCFHDLGLKGSTNIDQLDQFANRKTTKSITVAGDRIYEFVNDWLIEDFTAEELKEVKVIQQDIGIRPNYFNDLFHVPTFQEYLNTVKSISNRMNKAFGLIPELKNPKFHNRNNTGIDHFMEKKFLNEMATNGFNLNSNLPSCPSSWVKCPPIIIQCFEKETLQYFKSHGIGPNSAQLLYLVDEIQPLDLTHGGLDLIAEFCEIYSIWKEFVYFGVEKVYSRLGIELPEEILIELEELGGFIPAEKFSKEAHKRGLKMGIYTIRDSREPTFTNNNPIVQKECELYYYFYLGIDNIFVENVAEARELRNKYDNKMKINAAKTLNVGYTIERFLRQQAARGLILTRPTLNQQRPSDRGYIRTNFV